MLLPVERKRLRDQGRDAFYKQHGRDASVERAAAEALGANARRRDLDSWKRNMCGRRFMALTRARQLELLPAFASYHADEDAREAAETEASSASQAAAASSSVAGASLGIAEPSGVCEAEAAPSEAEGRGQKRKRGPAKGRKLHRWKDMKARTRKATVKHMLRLMSSRGADAKEVAACITDLAAAACRSYAGLAQELRQRGFNTQCRCAPLGEALNSVGEKVFASKVQELKVQYVRSVKAAGFHNRRHARRHGICVSNRTWKLDKDAPGSSAKLGRPSKMNNATLQEMVLRLAEKHSAETSKFMQRRLAGSKEKEDVLVRRWTSTPFQIYLNEEDLLKSMSFSTFFRMLKKVCPHIKEVHRLTDVCDHCELFKSRILPRLPFCFGLMLVLISPTCPFLLKVRSLEFCLARMLLYL